MEILQFCYILSYTPVIKTKVFSHFLNVFAKKLMYLAAFAKHENPEKRGLQYDNFILEKNLFFSDFRKIGLQLMFLSGASGAKHIFR